MPSNEGSAPVQFLPGERDAPEPGVGIALSGGGYRAMLFHLGALWRLADFGALSSGGLPEALERISSVSGGSITAAQLGVSWSRLRVDEPGSVDRFIDLVVEPIRRLAGRTVVGIGSGLAAVIRPGSINDHVTSQYRKHLFQAATLQDLPDHPRFVINATNLQSGALWRFSKPYIADWKVGRIDRPSVTLAEAVGASSAFPPFLSPARLEFSDDQYVPGSGASLQRPPFTTRPILSDGGVYDNLGLETVYKRYQTIIASNAGGQFQPKKEVPSSWGRQSYRVLSVIDHQVRSLRTRQLISAYVREERKGAYWGIRTNLEDYPAPGKLPCPFEKTTRLAEIATDLEKKEAIVQERLINWGYASCDAAMRSFVYKGLPPPAGFPYPAAGVG